MPGWRRCNSAKTPADRRAATAQTQAARRQQTALISLPRPGAYRRNAAPQGRPETAKPGAKKAPAGGRTIKSSACAALISAAAPAASFAA